SAVQKDVPAELDQVAMRALSRDRNDRYATAAEFADTLEQAAAAAGLTIAKASSVGALLRAPASTEVSEPLPEAVLPVVERRRADVASHQTASKSPGTVSPVDADSPILIAMRAASDADLQATAVAPLPPEVLEGSDEGGETPASARRGWLRTALVA